jgi:3-methyladenine DNA glycosylase Mpg
MSIDRALNGAALVPPDLYVIDDGAPRQRVYVTPRIGVQGTGRWERRLLRYCLDSPYLSRPLPRTIKRPNTSEGEQRRLPGREAGSALPTPR